MIAKQDQSLSPNSVPYPLPPRRPSLMYRRVVIIGNREPSALGMVGADTTFDDHAANRFSAASNLAGSIFDTSTPASTAALATWRPSFAAGLVGARVPGTSPLRIWSTRFDHLFRDRGG